MSIDAAFDLETTGVAPGCCILSVGVAIFDRDEAIGKVEDVFYGVVSYPHSKLFGFEDNPDTMKWWNKQNTAARDEVFRDGPDVYHPRDLLEELTVFFRQWRIKYLWCMGQDFDIPILRAYYDKFGIDWPVKYSMGRDIRTYCQAGKVDRYKLKPKGMVSHRADDDALWAAMCVQAAYERLANV